MDGPVIETERCTQAISLRISVTDRCQLRCVYCMPPEGIPWVSRESMLSYEQIARFVAVARKRFGLSKVHLTGGEPLLRPNVADLVAMLRTSGVSDLVLTTNAQKLAAMAVPLRQAGLDRINVSLDTLDPDLYGTLTRGADLTRVLEGIDAAFAAGFPTVKINTLVLRGCNDGEVVSLAQWACDRGCQIRFLELMPIGPVAARQSELFVPVSEVRKSLESAFHLVPVCEHGGTGLLYQATGRDGRRGVAGFIASQSRPFCSGCRRLRLRSNGQLLGCLAVGAGPDISHLLDPIGGREDRLAEVIAGTLSLKRTTRHFHTVNLMSQTGG